MLTGCGSQQSLWTGRAVVHVALPASNLNVPHPLCHTNCKHTKNRATTPTNRRCPPAHIIPGLIDTVGSSPYHDGRDHAPNSALKTRQLAQEAAPKPKHTNCQHMLCTGKHHSSACRHPCRQHPWFTGNIGGAALNAFEDHITNSASTQGACPRGRAQKKHKLSTVYTHVNT